jgi:hypothetical protein
MQYVYTELFFSLSSASKKKDRRSDLFRFFTLHDKALLAAYLNAISFP